MRSRTPDERSWAPDVTTSFQPPSVLPTAGGFAFGQPAATSNFSFGATNGAGAGGFTFSAQNQNAFGNNAMNSAPPQQIGSSNAPQPQTPIFAFGTTPANPPQPASGNASPSGSAPSSFNLFGSSTSGNTALGQGGQTALKPAAAFPFTTPNPFSSSGTSVSTPSQSASTGLFGKPATSASAGSAQNQINPSTPNNSIFQSGPGSISFGTPVASASTSGQTAQKVNLFPVGSGGFTFGGQNQNKEVTSGSDPSKTGQLPNFFPPASNSSTNNPSVSATSGSGTPQAKSFPNLFGASTSASPASNLFNQQTPSSDISQEKPAGILWDSPTKAFPASTQSNETNTSGSIFQAKPPTYAFGVSAPSQSTLEQNSQATPINTQAGSVGTLFGTPKPTQSPWKEDVQATPGSAVSQSSASSSLLGGGSRRYGVDPADAFSQGALQAAPTSSNLFTPQKTTSAAKPPSMFPTPSAPTPTSTFSSQFQDSGKVATGKLPLISNFLEARSFSLLTPDPEQLGSMLARPGGCDGNPFLRIEIPAAPEHFNEIQRQQFEFSYRLRVLEVARSRVDRSKEISEAELKASKLVYEELAEGIFKHSGYKRPPPERDPAEERPSKRLNMEGPAVGGKASAEPLFGFPTASKRKPDEESEHSEGIAQSGNKRAQTSEPSQPPSESQTSKTSQLFTSITQNATTSQTQATPPPVFKFNPSAATSSISPLKPPFFGASKPSSVSAANPPSFSIGTTSGSESESAKSTSSGPPKFGAASGTNFMAQFGAKSKETLAKAKAERKDEDYDSEEETEEDYEKRDAEEQRAKKEKYDAITKNKSLAFKPSFGTPSAGSKTAPFPFGSSGSVLAVPKGTGSGTSSPNIFESLSQAGSDAEGSKIGDADNEESEEDEEDEEGDDAEGDVEETVEDEDEDEEDEDEDEDEEETDEGAKTPTGPPGRSLFDRIQRDANGNPLREIPPESETEKKKRTDFEDLIPSKFRSSLAPSTGGLFATAPSSQTQAASPSGSEGGLFGSFGSKSGDPSSTSPGAGDHTWKPDSPIKFAKSVTEPPTVNITSPSPTKNTTEQKTGPFGSRFSTPKVGDGSTGLFSNLNKSTTPSGSSTPSGGIFGTSVTSNPFAHLASKSGTPSGTSTPSLGFTFGGPKLAAGTLAPQSVFSTNTSRATSPGFTTGEESNVEATDDENAHTANDPQLDLSTSNAGEENETVLMQVKARASEFVSKYESQEKEWVVRGVGELKLLKHKENGKVRIVVRAVPSAKIVLNAALINTVEYELGANGKSVTFPVAGASGALSKWVIQVKLPEDANRLAEVMEENKSN